MKTALERDETELDPADCVSLAQIREHGWFATRVYDPER